MILLRLLGLLFAALLLPTGTSVAHSASVPRLDDRQQLIGSISSDIAAVRCSWAEKHIKEITQVQARYAVRCLINNERRVAGLSALRADARLADAALGHVNAAVTLKWWTPGANSHTNPQTGSTPVSRTRAAGYCTAPTGAWRIAENTYWSTTPNDTPKGAVQWWMNSAGHRAAILNRDFRDLGVGVANGAPVPNQPLQSAAFVVDFGMCT